MKRLNYENGDLDRVDLAILECLVQDGRIRIAELARRVGLTPPSVGERIKRLEETGIITGYTAIIDPKALGRPLAILLRIRPVPGELKRVAEIVADAPEIVECIRVTGEDCYIARAYVRSVDELEALIDKIAPFAMTTTSIIQSAPVERRLPPLAAKPS